MTREFFPAFPVPSQVNPYSHEAGMTLRDYFAAQALVGMGQWWPTVPGDHQARAVWAYDAADAMLAAREATS